MIQTWIGRTDQLLIHINCTVTEWTCMVSKEKKKELHYTEPIRSLKDVLECTANLKSITREDAIKNMNAAGGRGGAFLCDVSLKV